MTKLHEEITPEVVKKSDSLDYIHGTSLDDNTTDKVYEAHGGKLHSIVDLHSSSSDADPDVQEHLEKHGYKVHDYKKGIATTEKLVGNPEKGIPMQKKQIKESIGKVLAKTNAPDSLKHTFESDPTRKASSHDNSKLKVLISTHPTAIAGKSQGTSWEGQSCMRYNHTNSEFLESDAEHATHEAFLIHHNDPTAHLGYPSNPLARISLKLHTNTKDHSDSIYRPEITGYGADSGDFHHTVNMWSEKHFKGAPGATYEKADRLYHDGGDPNHYVLSHDDIANMHEHGNINNAVLTHDDIGHAINSAKSANPTYGLRNSQIDNLSKGISNLNSGHLNDIINSAHNKNQAAFDLANNHGDKLSTSAMERVRSHAASVGEELPYKLMQNSRLSDSVIDKLEPKELKHVSSNRLTTKHMDKFVNAYISRKHEYVHQLNINKDKLSEDQIHSIINHAGNNDLRMPINVMESKNFNHTHSEALDEHLSGHPEGVSAKNAVRYATVLPKHLAMHNPAQVFENKNATDEDKHEAVKQIRLQTGSDTRKAHGFALPAHSNKYFSDNDVHEMAENGVTNSHDKELSNRLIDAHLKHAEDTIHNTHISKIPHMEDEDELVDSHMHAMDKMYPTHKTMVNHAMVFGDTNESHGHIRKLDKLARRLNDASDKARSWNHSAYFVSPEDLAHDMGDDTIKSGLSYYQDEFGHHNPE